MIHSEPVREGRSPCKSDLYSLGGRVALFVPTDVPPLVLLAQVVGASVFDLKNYQLTSITNVDRSQSQDSRLPTIPEHHSSDSSSETYETALPEKIVIHPKYGVPCKASLLVTACRTVRDQPCRPKPVYKVPATLRGNIRRSPTTPHFVTQRKFTAHANNITTAQKLTSDSLFLQYCSDIVDALSRYLPIATRPGRSQGGRCHQVWRYHRSNTARFLGWRVRHYSGELGVADSTLLHRGRYGRV